MNFWSVKNVLKYKKFIERVLGNVIKRQYNTIQYNTIQYNTIQYNSLLPPNQKILHGTF